jgi:PAB-dependent poly(A)-specific ribonuclease subunit 3
VTRYDESATAAQQQEDLFDLGKLLVALACGTPSAVHNLPRSLEHIGRQYSQDVQKTILFLFSKPSPRKTIDEVLTILGTRLLDEYNASQKCVRSRRITGTILIPATAATTTVSRPS